MKYFLLFMALLSSANAFGGVWGSKSITIHSEVIDITTDKVGHIIGEINQKSAKRYYQETLATLNLKGPRVIEIDSPGGDMAAGQVIINLMEAEKAHGVKMVCVVDSMAHSMAFDILTHCDVRLARADAQFVAHNAALSQWDDSLRMTAKNLHTVANQIEMVDRSYRIANAKAMHLTQAEYDKAADEEKCWSVRELIRLGYLHGTLND